MTEGDDPYEIDELLFRTVGRNLCHWCQLRPPAWVWGPYGTRVCDHCQVMIFDGRAAEVVDELAARMTVRDALGVVDPERWRAHQWALMARWLTIRTDCWPL